MSDESNQLKIAIIVPYRDLHPAQKRAEHLKKFIAYMGPFMEKAINQFSSNSSFHIFIVEQSPKHKFNRGTLLNVGFVVDCRPEGTITSSVDTYLTYLNSVSVGGCLCYEPCTP